MVSGIVTTLLIVSFLGIAGWAYSKRRAADFADAAALPLLADRSERT